MEGVLFLVLLAGVIVFLMSRGRRNDRDARPGKSTFEQALARRRPPSAPEPPATEPAEAALEGSAYVVDGDSLVIRNTQIRLFGVDAPELNHPYGKKAKWALHALCKGRQVRAEITQQDIHGRTVAKCYLDDDRDLSAEMVKLGLAIDWPKFSGGRYRSLEIEGARKKLWLADARQKGHKHVWNRYEAQQKARNTKE